jgi:hypothetical protein
MTTDLEMILGYRGAIDAGDVSELAPDIISMPFWTPEFCDVVIRAAEATGAFDSDPSDPVPGHEVSLAVISPRLFEAVENDIGMRMWPAIKNWWPLVDYHGLRDVFVIKYAIGQQEELRLHHDVAQVSASIKLNDNYTGGVLEFPRQSFDNSAVPVGSLIAWPSLVTHPHASTPLSNGVKYSLTIWCELPIPLDL